MGCYNNRFIFRIKKKKGLTCTQGLFWSFKESLQLHIVKQLNSALNPILLKSSANMVSFWHIHLNATKALDRTVPVGLFSLNWEGLNQLM